VRGLSRPVSPSCNRLNPILGWHRRHIHPDGQFTHAADGAFPCQTSIKRPARCSVNTVGVQRCRGAPNRGSGPTGRRGQRLGRALGGGK
jgi:hypothetical protein